MIVSRITLSNARLTWPSLPSLEVLERGRHHITFGDIERMRLPDALSASEIMEIYQIPDDATYQEAKDIVYAKVKEGLVGYLNVWHEKEDVTRYHKAMKNLELLPDKIRDLDLLDAMLLHLNIHSCAGICFIREVAELELKYRKEYARDNFKLSA